MTVWRWAALLVLAAGLAACSAPPARVARERNLAPGEVLGRVAERNAAIGTLRGDGSITIESPERSSNGGFDLNLRKPDSVRVVLHSPFGITVGTLLLARERFVFYNSLDNSAYVGAPDGGTLGSMFNITLRFDEILRAFTGEFGAAGPGDSLERFGVESGEYVARYRSADGGASECRIDGDAFVVTSYRRFDASGKETLRATASDIDATDGKAAMPHLLRIVFPAEHRSITVSYDDVRVNDSVECAFELPAQAEIHHRE